MELLIVTKKANHLISQFRLNIVDKFFKKLNCNILLYLTKTHESISASFSLPYLELPSSAASPTLLQVN